MRVIGTAGTDEGLSMIREQGAHEVLNHRESDYLQRSCRSRAAAASNVVLEMLANVNLDRDLDVLALSGPRRRHRQPRPHRNRPSQDDGQGRSHPRDDALQRHAREKLAEIHAGLVAGLENGSLNRCRTRVAARGRSQGSRSRHGVGGVGEDCPDPVTRESSSHVQSVTLTIKASLARALHRRSRSRTFRMGRRRRACDR